MPASKNILGPDPARGAVALRPAKTTVPIEAPQWFNVCTNPNDPNQTKITADFLNDLAGVSREFIATSGAAQSETAANSDLMFAEAAARYASLGVFGTGGGTANAQTVTAIGAAVPPKAYFDGMLVIWNPPAVNTGAATLAPWGLAAKAITDYAGNALTGGELRPPCAAVYSLAADKLLLLPWSGLQFAFSSYRARLAANQAAPTVNVYTTVLVANGVNPAWATLASGVITLTRSGSYRLTGFLTHNNPAATGIRIVRDRSGTLEYICGASHTTGAANNTLNISGECTDALVGDKFMMQNLQTGTPSAIPASTVTSGATHYTELTVSRIAN